MSEKRRDKRGRVLHEGETQGADGRYRYSYTDNNGKRKQVYSWKLVLTDPLPKGKRECVALRDLESEIRKVEEQHRSLTTTDMTVYDLVEWYTANKAGVKATTKTGYKTVRNLLQNDSFGLCVLLPVPRPAFPSSFSDRCPARGNTFRPRSGILPLAV